MPNRLAQETSPYLRQHQDNPVDWYPWGDEAFAVARERGVPIFLSVGYSSCHWCHVMAHESFEDDTTAQLMNERFVNVKVDREERPDVDAIYMQAVQAMTGRGGWPMSVWLTHDGRPFYGGTYYPDQDRHGMPSFTRVCTALSAAWRDKPEEIAEQAEQLTNAIDADVLRNASGGALSTELLRAAYQGVASQFEPRYGGFGHAPKFPQAMTVDFVCRASLRNRSPETLQILTTTLDAMAAGGMYDQVGGGFARYSVDDFWLVPHFEKMLYDNALLTRAYLHGFQRTGNERYRRIVTETIEYVLRDLRDPSGGFYAAEDADSEGVEGKFYVWSLEEVREVAGDDADEAIRYYGVTVGGNFVDPHTGFSGNVLHVVARTEEPNDAVRRAREKLFARRTTRVRPGLDDKVLLAWNALFLDALTEAATAFERDDWMDAARTNARFLVRELRRADGRWLRSWRAPYLAFAEDYAALLEALCTLAELDDLGWLEQAREVADELVRLFADAEGDGFFTTGHDAETLIIRQKDVFDDATPSANAMAANGLLRLSALTGDNAYDTRARAWLARVGPTMASHPTAFAHSLQALERAVTPPVEVVVIGDPTNDDARALWREVTARLRPNTVVVRGAAPDPAPTTPLLEARTLVGGAPTAYVCEGYACRQPVTDVQELRGQLDAVLGQQAAT
ncbi:MAG TPA: thioredoxin domain-containing protein [Acidimicrobiia bacterium]|nr:thioredoxin domain-containing protein [Acidimicrobiia bacterium]